MQWRLYERAGPLVSVLVVQDPGTARSGRPAETGRALHGGHVMFGQQR